MTAHDAHAPTCPIPCCTSADDPNVAGHPGSHLTGMPVFYLTFFELDADRPNPRAEWAHPDGFVTIEAPNRYAARAVAVGTFGLHWCDLYAADTFDPAMYPYGELLRIVVPAELFEQEDHRV